MSASSGNLPSRYDFFNVGIHPLSMEDTVQIIKQFNFNASSYICFPDSSVIREANRDEVLKKILNSSFLTLPDGKPLQLMGKLKGYRDIETISGYYLCRELLQTQQRHFFYGVDDSTLKKIIANIRRSFPEANIVGSKAPPKIEWHEIESSIRIRDDFKEIERLRPDYVWIGISSPKQDYIMYYFHKQLSGSLLLGIGGVFNYLADESLRSPEWVKNAGMRWFYRFWREPRRLGRKYFLTGIFLLLRFPFLFIQMLKSPFLKVNRGQE